METPGTTFAPEVSLPLFNPDGTIIGTILRPLSRDAVGPGREKVYLARDQATVAA